MALQVLRELEYAGVPGLGDLWDVKVDGETELPAPRQAAALHCSRQWVSCAWSWLASDGGLWPVACGCQARCGRRGSARSCLPGCRDAPRCSTTSRRGQHFSLVPQNIASMHCCTTAPQLAHCSARLQADGL